MPEQAPVQVFRGAQIRPVCDGGCGRRKLAFAYRGGLLTLCEPCFGRVDDWTGWLAVEDLHG